MPAMQYHIDIDDDNSGFTLIELAIVLTILALVMGGILVGRDIIKAAQTRITVSQIESYDAAAVAFKQKYNCLPGDCLNAANYGLSGSCSDIGTSICGNNVVGGTYILGLSGLQYRAKEFIDFWYHLSQSGLIGGNYIGYDAAVAAGYADVGTAFPATKLSSKVGIIPNANGSYLDAPNAFWTQVGFVLPAGSARTGNPIDLLVPADNYRIDSKMDDGLPDSGKVRLADLSTGHAVTGSYGLARDDGSLLAYGAAGATSNYCATTDTPAKYNIQNTTPYYSTATGTTMTTNCAIMILANF